MLRTLWRCAWRPWVFWYLRFKSLHSVPFFHLASLEFIAGKLMNIKTCRDMWHVQWKCRCSSSGHFCWWHRGAIHLFTWWLRFWRAFANAGLRVWRCRSLFFIFISDLCDWSSVFASTYLDIVEACCLSCIHCIHAFSLYRLRHSWWIRSECADSNLLRADSCQTTTPPLGPPGWSAVVNTLRPGETDANVCWLCRKRQALTKGHLNIWVVRVIQTHGMSSES